MPKNKKRFFQIKEVDKYPGFEKIYLKTPTDTITEQLQLLKMMCKQNIEKKNLTGNLPF